MDDAKCNQPAGAGHVVVLVCLPLFAAASVYEQTRFVLNGPPKAAKCVQFAFCVAYSVLAWRHIGCVEGCAWKETADF